MMDINDLKRELSKSGWRLEEDHVLYRNGYAWKQIDGPDCTLNEKSPCVIVAFYLGKHRSFLDLEVELVGAIGSDQRWLRLTRYGNSSDDLIEWINQAVRDVTVAWNAVASV